MLFTAHFSEWKPFFIVHRLHFLFPQYIFTVWNWHFPACANSLIVSLHMTFSSFHRACSLLFKHTFCSCCVQYMCNTGEVDGRLVPNTVYPLFGISLKLVGVQPKNVPCLCDRSKKIIIIYILRDWWSIVIQGNIYINKMHCFQKQYRSFFHCKVFFPMIKSD